MTLVLHFYDLYPRIVSATLVNMLATKEETIASCPLEPLWDDPLTATLASGAGTPSFKGSSWAPSPLKKRFSGFRIVFVTGQELDAEIGLYFYNARYYDPVLGRFTQADTIVPNPANPQTLNRYSYALNNPMRYTDPTGHLSEGDLGPGLQFDPAYYTQTPDPSSSSLSTDFTSANPYNLNLSVSDLTIDTSFAPLPTASDITASSTGESNGEGATAQFVGRTVIGEITGGITAETAAIAFMANDRLHRQASNRATLRYNKPPPRTIPPSGQTLDALQCFADCTGANSLLVTGGAEQSGHTPGSLHYQGLAVDVAPMPYNNLPPPNEVMSCAMPCGFTHGQFETFTNPARNHWHFQIGPGLGVPPLP